jgi:hypothetical protein
VPFLRRCLLIDAFVAGDPEADDFLRCESSGKGELALDTLDLLAELVLTVRSRAGAMIADVLVATGATNLASSSGNKENQLSTNRGSPPEKRAGDVSKLSCMLKGESLMSGEVMFVKVVEGGADWSGSAKMSLGDTVRAEPDAEGLIAVNADAGASQGDISAWRPT